ncbi:MAG: MBL fold metallo-hydrolase [Verrucomicrobia bacterium]|nr:MBL fold metallo-hydrolase [Verrucomicrobiota bacterium]
MSNLLSRREALRAFLFTAGALALPQWSFGQEASSKATPPPASTGVPKVAAATLGERLTLLTNAGGNVVVLTGDEGPLVVDAGVPAMGVALLAEVKRLSGNPNATLINTHWHFDHAGGNEAFARAGARIVAHRNCRERLSKDSVVEFLEMKAPAAPKIALPTVTVSDALTIHANGDDVRLSAVAPAHTDNDLLVFFAQANVLHMGDLYFNGIYPFIDYSSGGWIGGMVAAAEKALSLVDAKTKIVPGHGPLASKADLQGYRDFLATTHERLAKLLKQGRTIDEIVQAKPMQDFDEKLGKGFLPPEKFVRCTALGLQKHG